MDRTQLLRNGIFGGAIAAAFVGVALAAAFAPAHRDYFGTNAVELSGKEASETREVADFEAIALRGAYKLDLTAGQAYGLTLTADKAVLAKLETKVEGKTLKLGLEEGLRWRDQGRIEARVTMPMLSALTVDGSIDGKLASLDSESLAITINGAGEIEADGACGRLSLTTNGAGDFEGKELRCKSVAITINGAGDAAVYASESLSSTINGVGDVTVYGNPQSVSKTRSGFGSVTIISKSRMKDSE